MKPLLEKLNRRTTAGASAFFISSAYLVSRVLGLLRDRLLAAHFGVGALTDAYTAAFRIPELLFTLLVSGAFAVAFIPVLSEHLVKKEREQAWELSSAMLNLLMLGTLVVAGLVFIWADPLTKLVAPGFDPARHALTVKLTRIMLITPFCFAISSVMGSVQQAFNRFIFYAFASVFYNLGIIFGIMFLAPAHSIYGVAYGVVIGAGLQTLLQIVGLAGLGYRYRLTLGLKLKGVVKIFKLMIPRSIDQSIDQINYTVETVIGSRLAAGSLTAYYYANNLKNVPLAIFGTSIATAAFPRLAASAAGRDKTRLIEGFVSSMRLILFLVIPAGIIAFLMRGYIVRLLFGFGSSVTAQTLGWFAGTIIFQSLFFLVSRVFYALQDTKTPLYASLVAISLNIFLSLILSTRYGVVGLAMSQSVIAAFETLLLLWLLRPRLGSLGGRGAVKAVGQMLIAGLIMASVLYIMISRVLPLYLLDRGYFIVGPKFVLILAAGLVAYLGPSYLMGLREAKQLVRRAADQLRRPITYLGLQ